MKKNLAEDGFEDADQLTRAEIITAVQAAIWAYANVDAGNYGYSRTFSIPENSQWGGVIHDYTNEMDVWWETCKRVFSTDDTVAARINSLIEYLKELEAVQAEKNQIIISNIQVLDTALVQGKDDVYHVALQVLLNNSGSSNQDNIKLDVFVDDMLVKTEQIVYGTEEYIFTVEAEESQTIKAVVSGTQVLPKGVYFYEPEGGVMYPSVW